MTLPELELWFNSHDIPKELRLSEYEHTPNTLATINSHIGFLKARPGNKTFKPYFDRLLRIKITIENLNTK